MRILLTLTAALALSAGSASAATTETPLCNSVFGVRNDSLRAIAPRLHPQFLERSKRDSSVVVGLVFDSECRLTAHAIGRRPSDRVSTDTALANLFPAAKINPWVLSGFYEVGGRGPKSPWIVWVIRKAPENDAA